MTDQPNTLPPDLIARGYTLIIRTPDRMFAVSTRSGCTGTKATIAAVIAEARSLVRYLDWRTAKAGTR